MTTATGPRAGNAWNAVEQEKKLDRTIRRLCAGAWGLTFLITAVYAVLVSLEVVRVMRLRDVGVVTNEAVTNAATPLVIAIGILALLVAALSTVGVFLRFRTAALGEIQLRLATLEEILTRRGDAA